MSTDSADQPFIQFYQLYPDAPNPRRADPTLSGSALLRAYRHCEPYTAASGFGWYAFPPLDFSLRWDGETLYWKFDLDKPWAVLDDYVSLPAFAERWKRLGAGKISAPGPPPFLGRSVETGLVQIWTGLCIRTRPGWSVLVRPLANHPRDTRYEVLDGIIETDWWFGPIVTPIRIRKTDEPIRFQARRPLYQLQPITRESYDGASLSSMEVHRELDSLGDKDWAQLNQALTAHQESGVEKRGAYKREARRRAKRH